MTEREEFDLILAIADRAIREIQYFSREQKMALTMDIENFHRLQPLDLQRLLETTDGTFHHDVIGIWNTYDRATDSLRDCFVARCAASNHQPSHWGDDERAEARQMGITARD